jgi:predicted O-methyltransferase YrrM
MGKLAKVPLLLTSIRNNPTEVYDRLGTAWEVRRDRARSRPVSYSTLTFEAALRRMEEVLDQPLEPLLADGALSDLQRHFTLRSRALDTYAPFSTKHNGDTQLARFCYVVAKALIPDMVLETGVAYGVTSAHLLRALEDNGKGRLHSVDLPPLGKDADRYVGFLIPERLKDRWELHRGPTKRVLPEVLPALGPLDMFVQDSLHTYRTITQELTLVWDYLRSGGVLIADDIGDNAAFQDFSSSVRHAACLVVSETDKNSSFGVLVKR